MRIARDIHVSLVLAFMSLIMFNHHPSRAEENDPLCGAECLYVIHVSIAKVSMPFASFLRRMPAHGGDGFSLDQLRTFSNESGVNAEFASLNEILNTGLRKGQLAIIHKKPNHFQILLAISAFSANIRDSNGSSAQIPLQEFLRTYTSTCLVIGDVKTGSVVRSYAIWGWACIILAISSALFIVYRFGRRSGIWVVVVLCLTTTGCGTNRSPRFSCDCTSRELGLLHPDVKQETQFAIRNTGNATLVISDISTSCGCAKVRLSQRRIEPGKEAIMFLEILASKTGPRSAFVKMNTNDPLNPISSFSAEWTIGEQVGFSIPRILASFSQKVHELNIEFYVIPKWRKDWKYLFESKSKDLPFTVEATQGDKTHTFVAKLVHLEPGVFEGVLKIVDADFMVLTELPWTINVIPSLRVYPDILEINMNRDAPRNVSLVVEARERSSVRVEGEDGNSLEYVSEEIRPGVFDVSLTLTDSFVDSRIRVFAEGQFVDVKVVWLRSDVTDE